MSTQATNSTAILNQRLGNLDQQVAAIAGRMEHLSLNSDQGEDHAEVRREIGAL